MKHLLPLLAGVLATAAGMVMAIAVYLVNPWVLILLNGLAVGIWVGRYTAQELAWTRRYKRARGMA